MSSTAVILSRFIDLLASVGDIFMFDISKFFASPDCFGNGGDGMDPIGKWYISMMMPWLLAFVFVIWYAMAKRHFSKTKKYDSDVIQTILRSAVNVLLIGGYATV